MKKITRFMTLAVLAASSVTGLTALSAPAAYAATCRTGFSPVGDIVEVRCNSRHNIMVLFQHCGRNWNSSDPRLRFVQARYDRVVGPAGTRFQDNQSSSFPEWTIYGRRTLVFQDGRQIAGQSSGRIPPIETNRC